MTQSNDDAVNACGTGCHEGLTHVSTSRNDAGESCGIEEFAQQH